MKLHCVFWVLLVAVYCTGPNTLYELFTLERWFWQTDLKLVYHIFLMRDENKNFKTNVFLACKMISLTMIFTHRDGIVAEPSLSDRVISHLSRVPEICLGKPIFYKSVFS